MRGSGGIYIPYRVYMTGVGDSVKGEETRCTTRFGYGTWSVVCTILGSIVIHQIQLWRLAGVRDRA